MFRRYTTVFITLCGAAPLILVSSAGHADDWTPLWTTSTLSQARFDIAATTVGGQVFFGGGCSHSTLDSAASSVVDVYDVGNNSWTTMNLSFGRYELAAASLNGKVFFGGGGILFSDLGEGCDTYDRVDIYDTATHSWSTSSLSSPSCGLAATAVGNKVLFGGGDGGIMDIYDTASGSWLTGTPLGFSKYLAAASTRRAMSLTFTTRPVVPGQSRTSQKRSSLLQQPPCAAKFFSRVVTITVIAT
ncbi:MAG: hypothetical protein ABSA77_12835 [Thermoguttaceae bacterium]|jgi:hypothetical protein